MKKIAVLIPCYNESKTIQKVVADYRTALPEADIYVYDNNSSAMVVPGGVNFTIHSHGATSCELLLFHRKETVPYATIPFPSHYRIGVHLLPL